jgi:hypothetical protein
MRSERVRIPLEMRCKARRFEFFMMFLDIIKEWLRNRLEAITNKTIDCWNMSLKVFKSELILFNFI